MGQFTSYCPDCGKEHHWFIEANPTSCPGCGFPLTEEIIRDSFKNEFPHYSEFWEVVRDEFPDVEMNDSNMVDMHRIYCHLHEGKYPKLKLEHVKYAYEYPLIYKRFVEFQKNIVVSSDDFDLSVLLEHAHKESGYGRLYEMINDCFLAERHDLVDDFMDSIPDDANEHFVFTVVEMGMEDKAKLKRRDALVDRFYDMWLPHWEGNGNKYLLDWVCGRIKD